MTVSAIAAGMVGVSGLLYYERGYKTDLLSHITEERHRSVHWSSHRQATAEQGSLCCGFQMF